MDWPGELLFFALTAGFVGALLLYAGLMWWLVALVVIAIEAGHLWNSRVLER